MTRSKNKVRNTYPKNNNVGGVNKLSADYLEREAALALEQTLYTGDMTAIENYCTIGSGNSDGSHQLTTKHVVSLVKAIIAQMIHDKRDDALPMRESMLGRMPFLSLTSTLPFGFNHTSEMGLDSLDMNKHESDHESAVDFVVELGQPNEQVESEKSILFREEAEELAGDEGANDTSFVSEGDVILNDRQSERVLLHELRQDNYTTSDKTNEGDIIAEHDSLDEEVEGGERHVREVGERKFREGGERHVPEDRGERNDGSEVKHMVSAHEVNDQDDADDEVLGDIEDNNDENNTTSNSGGSSHDYYDIKEYDELLRYTNQQYDDEHDNQTEEEDDDEQQEDDIYGIEEQLQMKLLTIGSFDPEWSQTKPSPIYTRPKVTKSTVSKSAPSGKPLLASTTASATNEGSIQEYVKVKVKGNATASAAPRQVAAADVRTEEVGVGDKEIILRSRTIRPTTTKAATIPISTSNTGLRSLKKGNNTVPLVGNNRTIKSSLAGGGGGGGGVTVNKEVGRIKAPLPTFTAIGKTSKTKKKTREVEEEVKKMRKAKDNSMAPKSNTKSLGVSSSQQMTMNTAGQPSLVRRSISAGENVRPKSYLQDPVISTNQSAKTKKMTPLTSTNNKKVLSKSLDNRLLNSEKKVGSSKHQAMMANYVRKSLHILNDMKSGQQQQVKQQQKNKKK